MKDSIYETITNRIVELLEKGVVPWRKPWKKDSHGDLFPKNFVSKKAYRGFNSFFLRCQGFSSNSWLTFNQAKEIGASVKKGEKSTPIIFWKFYEKETEHGKEVLPCLKYFNVFNVEQCDGIQHVPPAIIEKPLFEPIQACENVLSTLPLGMAKITHSGERAYYSPIRDSVNMPAAELFDNPESYYAVLFHELTHATGHKSRLNREGVQGQSSFGDAVYSKEELIAECGASFLCGYTGIETSTIDNSAAYISNWLASLRKDSKLVIQAAAQAQKAVDYILNITHDKKEED